MRQFLNVLRFELGNYFKSKSFMVTTILLTLIMAAVVVVPPFFMGGGKEKESAHIEQSAGGDSSGEDTDKDVLAVADVNHVIEDMEMLTGSLPGYDVKVLDSADEVRQSVTDGEAKAGFLLTDQYAYTYVVENRSMMDSLKETFDGIYTGYWQNQMLKAEGIDVSAVQTIMGNRCTSETEILGKDSANNYWYTYVLIFVLYFLVIFYGQMIATSITSEKSNRAIEVLVTTVDSNSLIYGKVLAGALSGIFQAGMILGGALLAYRFTAERWDHMLDFLFDIPLAVWGGFIVFGILGYLLYAFIFGMLGALVSKTEDISKSATPVTMIFVASFIITMSGMAESDSILMKVASFVPFTSSNAMFARIALGSVSAVEIAVSAAILLVTVAVCAFLAAKIFRFGTLMYGNPIKFTHALKKIREE